MNTLLAFGHFTDTDRSVLAAASEEAASSLELVETAGEAASWRAENSAYGMLVDMGSRDCEALALQTRAEARHSQLPILAISRDSSELCFAEAYGWGADDVVGLKQWRPLVARLRNLPHVAPPPPINGRGEALVADPERARRVLLGRVLRNAGYTVSFATEAWDATEQVADKDLVVLSAELSDAPRAVIEASRRNGSEATFIVTCAPRQLGSQRAELGDLEHVVVTDGYAPAENVLFLANELSNGSAVDKRQSQRLLYGTSVAFREAGRDADDFGFSYNISEGGLYVRTLAPPDDDSVWLELTPPRSERRVRLVGRVVWRRPFSLSQRATVPPGFGVQIVDGARADLDAWREGYESFAAALT